MVADTAPAFPDLPPADVSHIRRKWLDLPYAARSSAQLVDIYLPDEGQGPFPVLLRIHGGGFEMGDKRDFNLAPWLGALDKGYALVSVNYRLSGEAVFPAAVQDVRAAIRWVRANGAAYGLDAGRMAVTGESAGGNLAALMAVAEGAGLFDDPDLGNEHQPCGVQVAVDWFGPIDFSTMDEQRARNALEAPLLGPAPAPASGGSFEDKYVGAPIGEAPEVVRAANPATYVHPAMPPLLIQHGRLDPLVPVQQSIEFARLIEERAGGDRVELDILEGAGHGGPEFESPENMDRVFRFIDRRLK